MTYSLLCILGHPINFESCIGRIVGRPEPPRSFCGVMHFALHLADELQSKSRMSDMGQHFGTHMLPFSLLHFATFCLHLKLIDFILQVVSECLYAIKSKQLVQQLSPKQLSFVKSKPSSASRSDSSTLQWLSRIMLSSKSDNYHLNLLLNRFSIQRQDMF